MSKVRVEGEVDRPLSLSFQEFAQFSEQISDVAQLIPGKEGGGVSLAQVLKSVGVSPRATHLQIESQDGSFSASLPLAQVQRAVLVYRLGEGPLPQAKGGPVRFLTPHDGACDKSDGHACANVKDLGLLRLLAE